MIRRMFIISALLVLFLSVVSQTQAHPTMKQIRTEITSTDVVNATDGQSGTYFLPAGVVESQIIWQPAYRNYAQDWGWTHTFAKPADLLPAKIDKINWATLEIEAWDVDGGEMDVLSSDGSLLGQLVYGDEAWKTTVLNLPGSALNDLLDGAADFWLDIDSTNDHIVWQVALRSSKLTVNYETLEPGKTQAPCEPIPAPGAIALGSLGVAGISWLRRRKTL